MDDYVPPASPDITFTFKGRDYVPPSSPAITFAFGVDEGGGSDDGLAAANFMILLTM